MGEYFFPSSVYGGSAGALAEAMGARTSCAQQSFVYHTYLATSQERRPPSPLRGTIRVTGHLPCFGSNPMKNGGRKT